MSKQTSEQVDPGQTGKRDTQARSAITWAKFQVKTKIKKKEKNGSHFALVVTLRACKTRLWSVTTNPPV